LELTNGKENAKIAVSGRLFADDFEVLKSLAASGEGIAFLPGLLCSEEKKHNQLIHILPAWHGDSVTFSLVYPAQRFVSAKIRAFITVTEEVLSNHI
jgi:LysR family transcriptional regulator for bpeEF and oprC